MNKNTLIIAIMLASFLSWLFGAYTIQILTADRWTSSQEVVNKQVTNIDIKDLESNVTKSVEKISPSVVSIIIKKDLAIFRSDPLGFFRQQVGTISRQVGWWTWFFITRDGKIITNKHVVADPNAEYIVITSDGKEHEAKILALDPLSDLAIIQIDSKNIYQPLKLVGESDKIKIWQFVIAIWNALAQFQNSVSFWVISGKNRSIDAQWEALNWLLQTDAAINPGNSWWPLVNLGGEVVGINSAISAEAQGIGFSIQLTQKRVDYMLDSLQKYWVIKRPLVWVNYVIITPEISQKYNIKANEWAYIPEGKWGIVEWSSASRAWLQWGDIITKVDGVTLNAQSDLWSLIQNRIPWDTIKLEVIKKNGQVENVDLVLWSV